MDNYQINSLSINDPANRFCGEIFINNEEIETKGSLLVLTEIESNKQEAVNLINNFFNITYGAYKQSLGNNTEKVLEDILHQLNQQLFAADLKEKKLWQKINAVVALIFENSLHFSPVGNVNAYLIRQIQISSLLTEKTESQNPQKIFSTIISGNLTTDDAFLFTTPALLDYLALEKIKKIISSLPPLSAIENFKNLLINVPPHINFLAIIIKQRLTAKPLAIKKVINYQNPREKATIAEQSINNLLKKQHETAKIISTPSLGQTILGKIKDLLNKLKITKKQNSLIKIILSFLLKQLIKIGRFVYLFFYYLMKIFIGLIGNTIKRQETIALINHKFVTTVNYFKALSKGKKIAWFVILICLLFLSQNLIWSARRQQKLLEEKYFQESLTQIKNYQDTIEASLIYNDLNRAQEILTGLISAIENLPKNSQDKIAKITELENTADILVQRVWKLTKIPDPVELIGLNIGGNQPRPQILKFINNQIIILAADRSWSSKLDGNNLAENNLPSMTNIAGSIKNSISSAGFIWTNDNKIYSWKNNGLQENTIQLAPTEKTITSLSSYGDAVYLLDRLANQIYKHKINGENLGPGIPWVKDPVITVNSGVSLSVDGNVYVLNESGQIQKFLLGKKQEFPELSLYPPLSKPKTIFTDKDTANIYILDPAGKRLVVISKDGQLINQYTSEKFDNLVDFIVLEKDKKAYFLNGDKVYVISIF